MTKEEFTNLLSNAGSILISLLGQTIKIIQMRGGVYEIGSITEAGSKEYSSVDEMLEDYQIMSMPLGSVTRWMAVEAVA